MVWLGALDVFPNPQLASEGSIRDTAKSISQHCTEFSVFDPIPHVNANKQWFQPWFESGATMCLSIHGTGVSFVGLDGWFRLTSPLKLKNEYPQKV